MDLKPIYLLYSVVFLVVFSIIYDWKTTKNKQKSQQRVKTKQNEILDFFKGKTDVYETDDINSKKKEIIRLAKKLYDAHKNSKDLVNKYIKITIANQNIYKGLKDNPDKTIYKLTSIYSDFKLVHYGLISRFLMKKKTPRNKGS